MQIGIIGAGYVGLVSAACLSDFGHNVVCFDNNKEKVNGLKKGLIPINRNAPSYRINAPQGQDLNDLN